MPPTGCRRTCACNCLPSQFIRHAVREHRGPLPSTWCTEPYRHRVLLQRPRPRRQQRHRADHARYGRCSAKWGRTAGSGAVHSLQQRKARRETERAHRDSCHKAARRNTDDRRASTIRSFYTGNASASPHASRMRAPAGLPRRLHDDPLAQEVSRPVSRWAALQGAGQ